MWSRQRIKIFVVITFFICYSYKNSTLTKLECSSQPSCILTILRGLKMLKSKFSNTYRLPMLSTLLYVRENTPEVQALIDAAVAEQVAGLKAKNSELLGKIKGVDETTAKLTQLEASLKAFEGIDPTKARALFAGIEGDEDAKLLMEGKLDQIKEKHTGRMKQAHEQEVKTLQEQIKAAQQVGEAYRGRVLDAQILAVSTGLHKGAVEDALLVGRSIFTLDAKGNAVKLDAEGKPELGKDGKTSFGPSEWMEAQRDAKPHWFPAASSGSGGKGNDGATGNGKTMKRSSFDAMMPSAQGSYIRAGGTVYD